MTELVTAARMRAIEKAAIDSGQVTGLDLMERAGRGVVEAILGQWPELARAAHGAVILCGPGNNGGDGFVIARLLRDRGWDVEVLVSGDPEKLPRDARTNHDRWSESGKTRPLAEGPTSGLGGSGGKAPELIVDALFGTGLTRPLTDDIARALSGIQRCKDRHDPHPPTVAVDTPSGLCADTGRMLTGAVDNALRHDLTVTFHRAKPGHYLAEGPARCGRLEVTDIGLSSGLAGVAAPGEEVLLNSCHGFGRERPGHKYERGHVLVLAGGPGRGGAARLAARGALRIGAGLVTVGCPPEALVENAAQLNAIMLTAVRDGGDLKRILGERRIDTLCVGPGLGLGQTGRGLVAASLASGIRTVLDADALTLIARDGALRAAVHGKCVLTPHLGEFRRLFPDIAARIAATDPGSDAIAKTTAARLAAEDIGATLLLKGHDTVISAPGERDLLNASAYDRAAPGLATAGSGDVLAGFVAGLLGRGALPRDAAATAAWCHVGCALEFGAGLIAEDLPEMLPLVLRGLGQ